MSNYLAGDGRMKEISDLQQKQRSGVTTGSVHYTVKPPETHKRKQMNKYSYAVKHGYRIMIAFAVAVTATILLSLSQFGTTANSAGLDDIEYGVIYSCPSMSNYAFKVLSCDAGGWCQVFIVNEASPKGGNVTGQGKSSILALIKKNDCTTAGRNRDDKGNPPPRVPKDPPPNGDAGDKQGGQGDCSTDPQLSVAPKPSDSMELRSKRAILARFQEAVDKGEKISIGITFDSFQIGTPRINVEDANFYETAPVGAKIYPIKSKFTLCSVYGTEITKDVTDGRYECFKDNVGDWACGTATGYHIINTTYGKRKKP